MKTAITMSVLAFLTLAIHSAAAGDWSSLGRVPKDRKVKVCLKSGQKLNGKIGEVGFDGLQLISEESRIRLKISELKEPVDKAQIGQIVQVSTTSGLALAGTLRKVDERFVWLENKDTVEIRRAEIRRVTYCSHWMGALIGLAIGAGAGAAIDKSHDFDIPGVLGAIAGGIIGVRRTIYDGTSTDQTGRR